MLKSSVNVNWVLKIHLVPSKTVKIECQKNDHSIKYFNNSNNSIQISVAFVKLWLDSWDTLLCQRHHMLSKFFTLANSKQCWQRWEWLSTFAQFLESLYIVDETSQQPLRYSHVTVKIAEMAFIEKILTFNFNHLTRN